MCFKCNTNRWFDSIKAMKLNNIRATTNFTMLSLLLVMFLYLALAISFCEGRSLHASLSHSRKDVAKLKVKDPSTSVKEAKKEKAYPAGIYGSCKNNNVKELDEIRKACLFSCFQRSKAVAVLRHRRPCRVSEENPGNKALVSCCHDGLSQRKQIKVRSEKRARSLVVGNKWNKEEINPNKNIADANFVDMDYPSAHLAPSVNNR